LTIVASGGYAEVVTAAALVAPVGDAGFEVGAALPSNSTTAFLETGMEGFSQAWRDATSPLSFSGSGPCTGGHLSGGPSLHLVLDHALTTACGDLARWRDQRRSRTPFILLDIPGQVLRERYLTDRLATALRAGPVPPDLLYLGIPGAVLATPSEIDEHLHQLSDFGTRLALTGFGGPAIGLAALTRHRGLSRSWRRPSPTSSVPMHPVTVTVTATRSAPSPPR
jgi:hypothetical protein